MTKYPWIKCEVELDIQDTPVWALDILESATQLYNNDLDQFVIQLIMDYIEKERATKNYME